MLLKRIIVAIMSIFWALFAYSFVGNAAPSLKDQTKIPSTYELRLH